MSKLRFNLPVAGGELILHTERLMTPREYVIIMQYFELVKPCIVAQPPADMLSNQLIPTPVIELRRRNQEYKGAK